MADDSLTGMDDFSGPWARKHLPSYGPNWDRAIELGIDVTLLLENWRCPRPSGCGGCSRRSSSMKR